MKRLSIFQLTLLQTAQQVPAELVRTSLQQRPLLDAQRLKRACKYLLLAE